MLLSPTGDASILMATYKDFVGVATFCCTNGNFMWGNRATMNHSLCCCDRIWNVKRSINVLNLWSKYHTDSLGFCLIYFNSVMHWDSDFGFFNYNINPVLISAKVLTCPVGTLV